MHSTERARGSGILDVAQARRGRGAALVAACAGLAALPGVAAAGDDFVSAPAFSLAAMTDEEAVAARAVRWNVTADFWAATVDGNFSLGGTPSSIDVGIFDFDSDEDDDDDEDDGAFGFSTRAEVAINRLVLFLGSSVAGAQDDGTTFRGVFGDMSVGLWWFEFGGGFRFIDLPGAAHDRSPAFSLDGLVGGRVTSVGAEFDPDFGGAEIDGNNTWIEPFVGGQMSWRPIPNLAIKLLGDVGGFGAGSEFSWRAEATIGWTMVLGGFNLNIHGGYRVIDQDFEDDLGSEFSGWDGAVYGPIAGVTFEF